MAEKQRYQNPTCGDTVVLRMFTYNSNNRADLQSVDKVEIYYLDPTLKEDSNPDGRRLVEEITSVTKEETGKYMVSVDLLQPEYTIGKYLDIWSVTFEGEECPAVIEQNFEVYPDLWYTTPIPIVYDFGFNFRPNRLRQGSKRYLIIEIMPNVPRASDLAKYYENLAIVSDLRINIEQRCGECVPEEQDLRLIADNELVDYREKRYGFFWLDTSDLDCGIYDVWFELEFGENLYVSEKNQLQIH